MINFTAPRKAITQLRDLITLLTFSLVLQIFVSLFILPAINNDVCAG